MGTRLKNPYVFLEADSDSVQLLPLNQLISVRTRFPKLIIELIHKHKYKKANSLQTFNVIFNRKYKIFLIL